jgi:hypothetical protein
VGVDVGRAGVGVGGAGVGVAFSGLAVGGSDGADAVGVGVAGRQAVKRITDMSHTVVDQNL